VLLNRVAAGGRKAGEGMGRWGQGPCASPARQLQAAERCHKRERKPNHAPVLQRQQYARRAWRWGWAARCACCTGSGTNQL